MKSPTSICAVTGSRADFGLLSPILKEIKEKSKIDLRLVVTGTHLAKEFGDTKILKERQPAVALQKKIAALRKASKSPP